MLHHRVPHFCCQLYYYTMTQNHWIHFGFQMYYYKETLFQQQRFYLHLYYYIMNYNLWMHLHFQMYCLIENRFLLQYFGLQYYYTMLVLQQLHFGFQYSHFLLYLPKHLSQLQCLNFPNCYYIENQNLKLYYWFHQY